MSEISKVSESTEAIRPRGLRPIAVRRLPEPNPLPVSGDGWTFVDDDGTELLIISAREDEDDNPFGDGFEEEDGYVDISQDSNSSGRDMDRQLGEDFEAEDLPDDELDEEFEDGLKF